jgi:hypothetical protein
VGDINIGLGGLAEYGEDKLRRLFGKDSDSIGFRRRIKRRWQLSNDLSRSVQCVGMDRPIPIEEIYQALRLSRATDDLVQWSADFNDVD